MEVSNDLQPELHQKASEQLSIGIQIKSSPFCCDQFSLLAWSNLNPAMCSLMGFWVLSIAIISTQPVVALQLNSANADFSDGSTTAIETIPTQPFLVSQALGSRILQLGDFGDSVYQLQSRLAELGYYQGSLTGTFDSATEDAVLRFQAANNLSVDGIVGPETAAAIESTPSVPNSSVPLSIQSQSFNVGVNPNDDILEAEETGPDVATLQTRLSELGYYQGTVDGIYGPGTVDAVTRFQRDRGLVADGLAGPATNSAILNSTGSTTRSSTFNSSSVRTRITQAPTPSRTVSSTERFSVLALQRRLRSRGFYSGQLDGQLGPATRDAITRAQQSYGLSRDDILRGRF